MEDKEVELCSPVVAEEGADIEAEVEVEVAIEDLQMPGLLAVRAAATDLEQQVVGLADVTDGWKDETYFLGDELSMAFAGCVRRSRIVQARSEEEADLPNMNCEVNEKEADEDDVVDVDFEPMSCCVVVDQNRWGVARQMRPGVMDNAGVLVPGHLRPHDGSYEGH